MRALFEWLSYSLQSFSIVALLASFLWGVLSILLSPCHLSSIPLVVGFIGKQGNMGTKRAFWIAAFFSSGILVTIVIVGLITGLLGRMMGDMGEYVNYLVAIILVIVGLYLLEIIDLPFLRQPKYTGLKRKGFIAAFMLGLIFGFAIGPCTFAYMAPMLGIVFSIASTHFSQAVLLVLFYAVGHCSIIILAGTSTGLVQHYLNWNEKSRGAIILKKVCGVLVILGGIYLVFG